MVDPYPEGSKGLSAAFLVIGQRELSGCGKAIVNFRLGCNANLERVNLLFDGEVLAVRPPIPDTGQG